MTTALLITTYNAPRDLQLILNSVAAQSMQPDEIIIADDGSRDETRQMIESFRPTFGTRLKHIWQPDEGFRASAIRNKAIAAATADYLIMVDGDVILHRHFIRDHVKFARPGTFVAGKRSKLSPEVSEKIRKGEYHGHLAWWSAPMEDLRLYTIRAPWVAPLIKNHHQGSVRQLISCNLACWRKDALEVNGYDESFTTWGEEDREFAARLFNIGLRRRNMIFAGLQFHLYHYSRRDEDTIESNGGRLHDTIVTGRTRCKDGIVKE